MIIYRRRESLPVVDINPLKGDEANESAAREYSSLFTGFFIMPSRHSSVESFMSFRSFSVRESEYQNETPSLNESESPSSYAYSHTVESKPSLRHYPQPKLRLHHATIPVLTPPRRIESASAGVILAESSIYTCDDSFETTPYSVWS